MKSTTNTAAPTVDIGADTNADPTVAICACQLYDAECALHAAHQSGVDAWIDAAADKLRDALADYLAAVAAITALFD